jgi:peptidoglycan/xylan/chitin deacetylase (PgdA/CDA1 family)
MKLSKWFVVSLFICFARVLNAQEQYDEFGALVRSDLQKREIYLCFTGHDFNEGFDYVLKVLDEADVKASFFLTGDFIRNNRSLVERMDHAGHFIGAHSDKHLLYCDWNKRDSLLYTPSIIKSDIIKNLQVLEDMGIQPDYFMPPYEWYNGEVVKIASALDQVTINFSAGTRSNADYTTPDMPNYVSSETIFESILAYERQNGMNGFHLLIHPGTDPLRKDKFYKSLGALIVYLKAKNYFFVDFN